MGNSILTLLLAVGVAAAAWWMQREVAPLRTGVLLQVPAANGAAEPGLELRVARAAAEALRAAGREVTVLQGQPRRRGKLAYVADVGLYLRSGAADLPCRGGAAVGHDRPQDAEAAALWRSLYGAQWPHAWQQAPTRSEPVLWQVRGKVELSLTLGQRACAAQWRWLQARPEALGGLVARFAEALLDQAPPAVARPTGTL